MFRNDSKENAMERSIRLAVNVEKPTPEQLDLLKKQNWAIWSKEVSTFDWYYDEKEVCYFLDGDVTVKTPEGDVSFGKGDWVTFPKGLSCTWVIRKAVKKYYRFGD